MKRTILYLLSLVLCTSINAQSTKKKWDVSNPGENWNVQSVPLNTKEGTWMNLDVSPDGKTLVFDMLGDIYSMPVAGGKATPLRSGLPYEVQPRFSPDGKFISFTSDAGGGDNIWIMKKDGSDAKQVTKENFRLLNNAVWTTDGNYLIARKHFTSTRSLGAGELWMYHKTGGSGVRLTKRKNDQQDLGEPSVSKDGKYVYYSEDVYPGGYFQYNKDANSQIYVVNRYNLQDGSIERITGGPGGACRPQISPDGKTLAFIKRVREKTVLYLHNLETGEEWPIFDQLSKDQQQAWAIFGTYSNFNWLPDGNSIIVWAKGTLHKIEIQEKKVSNIPFEVTNDIQIASTVRFANAVDQETLEVKVLRNAVTSPDGKTLAFNALGHIWTKTLPNGKPKRVTKASELEFEPNFSPDGKKLVYVTWSDETKGAVMELDLSAKKASPIAITKEKGIYRMPAYSNNGRHIVYVKERGNNHQGHTYTKKSGIYLYSVASKSHMYTEVNGEYPSFDEKDNRIYYQTGGYFFGNITKKLNSIKTDGTDFRTHVTGKYANRIVPSPDGKWVAFLQLHKAFVAAMPPAGTTINLDSKSKAYPVQQITKDAGINLHWAKDASAIHWTLGGTYYSNLLKDRFLFLENAPDSIPPLTDTGIAVDLKVKSDRPEGLVAFTNATILTMKGEEVIEKGTIIVEDNKIIALGTTNSVSIPKNAVVIDATGKTIMPGIIDVHAHLGAFRYGISPEKHWQYYTNLAFGVTTTHDPSSNTEMVFAQSEMVKSGEMIGPRIFSTGIILYGADGDFKAVINNLEDARSALRRTKAFGAFSVKSYNQPRREQRQQIIQAARELKINVYPEGGSTFFHNMSMIMDGHTGVEHNIPVAPVYRDVVTLWSNSNTGYTPTLIVNYGGMSGENYWYQTDNVWENERLLTFTPRGIIDSRARHRTMVPMKEYDNGYILTSESCKKLADAGVKVNLGAHGQIQGLGAHWELWMLAQGGISNMQALKSATINGAEYLGMEKEIGSLEVGKLADLIVLDKNPLEDIKNSQSVRYTMINGRLYDAATMNEIGNYDKKRSKFYWEMNNYSQAFPWHENTQSFEEGACSCITGH